MSEQSNAASVFDRAAEFVSEMWSHNGPRSEMHVGDLPLLAERHRSAAPLDEQRWADSGAHDVRRV